MGAKKETPAGRASGLGQSRETSLYQHDTNQSAPCQSNAAAQRRRILEHLQHDTLTTLQARAMGAIMHPAARCMELRKQGHQIVTEWALEYCPGGVRHRVALYRLKAGEVDA